MAMVATHTSTRIRQIQPTSSRTTHSSIKLTARLASSGRQVQQQILLLAFSRAGRSAAVQGRQQTTGSVAPIMYCSMRPWREVLGIQTRSIGEQTVSIVRQTEAIL